MQASDLSLLQQAQGIHEGDLKHLKHVEQMPSAYAACLAELLRRRAYKGLFLGKLKEMRGECLFLGVPSFLSFIYFSVSHPSLPVYCLPFFFFFRVQTASF